ncbi:MAG: TatD family hydrolase [Sulfurospirillaceae bacterium]|nr:TatD family hydrolase [Sulfurospirillaceae bacterium]
MIIDTHCHLDDIKYNDDLDDVIRRAEEQNVNGFLIPGADIEDLQRAKDISHKYYNIFYAAGIHPYHTDGYDESVLKEYLKDDRCIAVGECGLDYFRLPDNEEEKEKVKQVQRDIFAKHIDLAKELNKPLIVHIRDANDDSKRVLEENDAGKVGGVLHCYNASKHLLSLSELGFYFGIGGVLTFKNAKNLVEILPQIPKDKILIETDAPYLTPHPHRGERNEPLYTTFVAQKIAQILDMHIDEVEELTTNNAKRLFKAFSSLN